MVRIRPCRNLPSILIQLLLYLVFHHYEFIMMYERYLKGDHFDMNKCARLEGIIVHDFLLMYIKYYNEKAAKRGKCNISNYDIS